MKYFLLIIALFVVAVAKGQSAARGFFIVASGKDGIMVATDSRSAEYNSRSNITYGYHDNGVKTLVAGNAVMAVLGTDVFDGVYLHTFFEDYKKTLSAPPKVADVLPGFFNFCSKRMAPKDYTVLLKNRYIVAGYDNGMPSVCMQDGSVSKRDCVTEGWIRIACDASEFETKYSDTLKCDQLARVAEKAINKYASDNGLDDEIGGPIRILKITANGIQWLQNRPILHRTIEDHYKSYLSGKTPVTFISKEDKAKFDAMIRTDYSRLF